MTTHKNVEILGWTKKNLSAVIRIGKADYGDFRNGTIYAISQMGEIYRPIDFNEEFFTRENLPESANWVLTKEQIFSEKSLRIISTINKEFASQTGSLDSFIRTKFEYEGLINGTSIHRIEMPEVYEGSVYYPMLNALKFFKEKMKLQQDLTKSHERSSKLATELISLKSRVFAKFFVGKLGKRASTRRNQEEKFINAI